MKTTRLAAIFLPAFLCMAGCEERRIPPEEITCTYNAEAKTATITGTAHGATIATAKDLVAMRDGYTLTSKIIENVTPDASYDEVSVNLKDNFCIFNDTGEAKYHKFDLLEN